MPETPKKGSGSTMLNMIAAIRGNFDFKTPTTNTKTVAFGSTELISQAERSRILGGSFRAVEPNAPKPSGASILAIAQSSLSKVGSERLENRKILQLMPEVDKAAKLMIASTFSPNDLTRQNIPVVFDNTDISETYTTRLSEHATNFFQNKLNLKTSAPNWVYQWGYEAGAAVFAIVPLRSFDQIQEKSYLGLETFVNEVVDPVANVSLFGFGDTPRGATEIKAEIIGLESFSHNLLLEVAEDAREDKDKNKPIVQPTNTADVKVLLEQMIGQEALKLTDNPSILQVNDVAKQKMEKRTKNTLAQVYKQPRTEGIVTVSADKNITGKGGVVGNPIMMRLPPESVSIIHTPGDPSDHQGYLILLDHLGNPINAVTQEEDVKNSGRLKSAGQGNIISQVYNAYGLTSGIHGLSNADTMSRIYNQIVSEHLKKRMTKAGFTNVSLGNVDSVFRCMFARFLQQKQTRILFMPKELVSYMTFEMDQNGYGISRLDRIKFQLGMKMSVQISRVLAAIKAAMDRRKIEIRFADNLLEQPEAIFQNVVREYLNKSTMSFSVDPNVIQNQIADKSVSIKGIDIPGCEQFDLTNEPDSRTSSVDFDPALLEYIDKGILNGLHVPPSAMNSLSEDEYARSVATTNLFFAMDVSIDQDIVIKCISDLLRKYARYSEEFQSGIYAICPSLDDRKTKGISSTEEDDSDQDDSKDKRSKRGKTKTKPKSDSNEEYTIPDYYTIDSLIDEMTISLPHPNVAPSKAQFEALEAMISSITAAVGALFPDELMGADDSLGSTIRLLRAKFIAMNVRAYLETSGLNSIDIPETNFSDEMGDLIRLNEALQNVSAMLKDKAKINTPPDTLEGGADSSGIPGY